MSYFNMPICDSHIHVFWGVPIEERVQMIETYMSKNNIESLVIHSIPHITRLLDVQKCMFDNIYCLYYKTKLPGKVYSFAGFHHKQDPAQNTPEYYLEMAKFYMQAGFDGFKMIEDSLKNPDRTPFTNYDCEQFELFYDYCEKEQIPITIHTSGPEFSWHKGHTYHNAPLTFEECYDVFRRLLSRHPNLKLSLAHFFFISGHIDVASEFLDKYPNVYYDLTPNPFMYDDFAKNPEMWKEFFIKYQDRILFGTDTGDNYDDLELKHSDKLVYLVRTFLEGTEPFRIFDCDVVPINLDEIVLKKIYKDNFTKFLGRTSPKKPFPKKPTEAVSSFLAPW